MSDVEYIYITRRCFLLFFLMQALVASVFSEEADITAFGFKELLSSAVLNRSDFRVNMKEMERLQAEMEREQAAIFAPKIRIGINRERIFSPLQGLGGGHINREGLESSYRRTLAGGGEFVLGYGQSGGLFGTPDITGPERLFVSYNGALYGKSEQFLRAEYGLEQAEKEKLKSILAYGSAYQELVLEMARLYFSAFQAQNGLDTELSMLEHRRKLLAAARKRLALGVGTVADLRRAEVEVTAREERVLAAKNAQMNALRTLMNRSGRMAEFSMDRPLKLNGELNPALLSSASSGYISAALANRQELKIAMVDVEMVEGELEMVREFKRRKPVISGYLERNTAHTDFSPFAAHRGDYRLGLSYEIPIGDKERISEESALAAELAKRKLILADLQERIIMGVEEALGNISSATERLLLLEKNWEQAKESVRLSEAAYMKGVGTPLDLINAQDALLSTERIIVDAAAERKVAEFQLLREMAVFPYDTESIDEIRLLGAINEI